MLLYQVLNVEKLTNKKLLILKNNLVHYIIILHIFFYFYFFINYIYSSKSFTIKMSIFTKEIATIAITNS